MMQYSLSKLFNTQRLPVIFFVWLLLFFFHNNAHAVLQIGINQGNVEPLPLAIDTFAGDTWEEKDLGEQITNVISRDLQSSGLFRFINRAAFLEQLSVQKRPIFNNWRKVNAVSVIAGSVLALPDSKIIQIQFKMWDPYAEKQIAGVEYKISKSVWRKYAHKIADLIYWHMTGDTGYFDTKLLFISESGPVTRRVKKLAVIDQDGANYKLLTNGKSIVLTPRLDSKGQNALYVSYKDRVPHVYLLNLTSGWQRLVGNFPGMSFAPRFAPDDEHLAMSIAADGTTNLFEFHLPTGKLTKLTNDMGVINTSPCYSPDGRKIVFNSDRSGSRQLYIMDRDGSNIKRISRGSGAYAAPVWSPRGDFIAFTKMEGGTFYIGVMRENGSGERLLTSSWLDDAPAWSPNGRVIIFTRQRPDGVSHLYTIDLTGYNERRIDTETYASDPAWSALGH